MTLDYKRLALDTPVMGNKCCIIFLVMTITQPARTPSTATSDNGVCGVLVELVYVLFQF